MPFQPKIQRARFSAVDFGTDQMRGLGDMVIDMNRRRLAAGLLVDGTPARPLKPGKNGRPGYPDYKLKHGRAAIRDWNNTGRTLRGLNVLTVSGNSVTVGFSDPVADARAHINNLRQRQFGLSDADKADIAAHVAKLPVVTTKKG